MPTFERPQEPSVTIWSRLEPRTREETMERGVQAQVRDPLWLLARQWQVGEFLGSDGGSPVNATLDTESTPLTSYRPGDEGLATMALAGVPLEAHVEREPVALGLRGAVQLGQRFETLLRAGAASGHVDDFRTAYPIDAELAGEDAAARRLRLAAAGRCTDGVALLAAAAAAADLEALEPVPALPTGARVAAVNALEALLREREATYSEPDHDSAWSGQQLEYDFAVGAENAEAATALVADGYGGGELDWHAFDLSGETLAPPGGPAPQRETRSFIPTRVFFRGMPADRFWAFEDGQTDFGALDVQHVDLAKLLVMEFAFVYGGDWFAVPLPLPVGSLSSVTRLVVTDTFGVRTLIRPTGALSQPGEQPWSAFSLTGEPADRDLLLLPPTLAARQDGPALEDVLFLRDEMATMGWAVERTVQGSLDAPVDGYERYFERMQEHPPPKPRKRTPGGPPIEYVLGTTVPDNWIPLVPVQTSERSFLFRRGVMGSLGGEPSPGARARVLEPGTPFYVADEAVPRSGVEVERRFRRARWIDGSTVVWDGRRRRVGRGEGSSGLEFDAVRLLQDPGP